MQVLSDDHPAETVVMMASAQVGKTEILLNWAGYTIDIRPSPMMLVLPTVGIAEDFSKQRVSGLVADTPTIAAKMGGRRGRKASNTILNKEFPGGMLLLRGANSAAGLRSTPVGKLAMDEIDGYPRDVDGEGDPIKLAEARARTFARRKFFYCSTPTIKGQSRIEEAYLETDQRKYHVPCPECGHAQTLEWDRLKFGKNSSHDDGTAEYECEDCEHRIQESSKEQMLRGGEWVAMVDDAPEGKIGFHINALYSPMGWISWNEIAEEWRACQGNPTRLRVFVNTILGQTWESKGERPDWEKLYLRREEYERGTVPKGGIILTAGVDVQGDRLEAEVVAWGLNQESWSVDYRVLSGDPAKDDVWERLDEEVLDQQYSHENGGTLTIQAMAVDEGYETKAVRNYCAPPRGPRRVFTVKGRDNHPISISNEKSTDSGAVRHVVGTNLLKEEIYGWLRKSIPEEDAEDFPRGWMHFPQYGQEYFKGLTAEQTVVKTVRGRLAYAWEKVYERNEPLDTRIYARAAAIRMGLDRWSEARWRNAIDATHQTVEEKKYGNNDRYKDKARNKRGRRKSDWL